MNARDLDLLESHLDSNAELKTLWSKHQKLEASLKKLEKKPFLTNEEKVEKKRLQVDKLKGKTRIEDILDKLRKS
ncbi:MAG TPA: DUF465 domain-containing protein [bacterium]|nr:DUF465 domain-containing protein [bacterium]